MFYIILLLPLSLLAFTYTHVINENGISIHILTVDPTKESISAVKANGRESVKDLADQWGAVAAINGGFWKIDGTPAGILKVNQEWFRLATKPRGAIGWKSPGQSVLVDRLIGQAVPVSSPPLTDETDWEELDHIIGGTPLLIANGNMITDYSPEKTLESFLLKRHARTAVGIKESGEWVFVAVDAGWWGGMTMQELASYLFQLGCQDAVNLDGGGSSTMVIEGHVVNDPSGTVYEEGKWVELVSDAILIYPSQ